MKVIFKIVSLVLALAMAFTCAEGAGVLAAEEGEVVYLIDGDDRTSIRKAGLDLDTTVTNGKTYSGKWAFSKGNLKITSVTDVSEYQMMTVDVYGDSNYPAEFLVYIAADDKNTDGMDYYNCGSAKVEDGWHRYRFKINTASAVRNPLPLTNITGIIFAISGWGMENDTANTVLYLGDVVLYEDVPSIDITSDDVSPNIITVASNAVSDVSEAVCLKVDCPTALSYHEKKYINESDFSVTPKMIDGNPFVPAKFVFEEMGATTSFDSSENKMTITTSTERFTITEGIKIINKHKNSVAIDFAPVVQNGEFMVSLDTVEKALSKNAFWDDMGLIIFSDTELSYNKKDNLSTMVDIMNGFVFERPSREKIKADLLKTAPTHPRIYATANDFKRVKSYRNSNTEFKRWVNTIANKANSYINGAVNDTEDKPFLFASDSGGRLKNSYNVTDKAISLGMMYQLADEADREKYVDAMWYTLEDICDREKWPHWGAGHFLNAADVMEGVAIAYDWMYDGWSEERKAIIEEALYDCGLEDSLTSYYGADDHLMPPMSVGNRSGWTKWNSNWNSVCNGGVMVAAIALATHEEYSDLAAKAMEFAMQSNEIGLKCYAPDGGYPEGVGYWAYGTGGAVKLMNALQVACGTSSAYGLVHAPGFASTWAVPLYSESKQGAFNFGDNAQSRSDTSLVMWYANTFNRSDAAKIRYEEVYSKEKSPSYKDILWYRPENISTDVDLSLDYKFFDSATAMMRSSWTDKNQIFAAIHGGYNKAGHADLDSGTFVVDAENKRWFVELGSDNYNLPGYFSITASGKRWHYYRKRAEGQNVYVINTPELEEQSVDSRAYITDYVSKPRGAYAKVDLSDTYRKYVESATRGLMLTADRKAVVIQDEIIMKEPSEFHWFAHTKADVEIAEDKKSAILTLGSEQLGVWLISDDESLELDVMDAVSLPTSYEYIPEPGERGEYSRTGIRKLVIHAENIESVNMAIMCKPLTADKEIDYTYSYTSLANWAIPDGEIPNVTISTSGDTVTTNVVLNSDFDVSNGVKMLVGFYENSESGTKMVHSTFPTVLKASTYAYSASFKIPEKFSGCDEIKVFVWDEKMNSYFEVQNCK